MGRRLAARGPGNWPCPFWAGELDDWLLPPVLEWTDPGGGVSIQFQATFVQPECGKRINSGVWPCGRGGAADLPLVFFFGGMDCPPGMEGFGLRSFAASSPLPCVLVCPLRPRGTWWVLDAGGDFGYIDGRLRPEVVEAYAAWMRFLGRAAREEGGVDGERLRAMGFSAGAYALTEILAASREPLVWCLALGGLHGHGQPEAEGIGEGWRRQSAVENFGAYLERVGRHPGVPGGLFCFHHPEDRVCPWRHARAIIGAVDARQAQLGLPAAQVTELAELDRTSAKTTARQLEQGLAPQMHGYQDTAFLGDRFLRAFLRGPGARAHGGGWSTRAGEGDAWGRGRGGRSRGRSGGRSSSRPRLTLRPRSRPASRSRSRAVGGKPVRLVARRGGPDRW